MAEAPAGNEPVLSCDESVLTLKDLSNELEPVADWHTLGVRLGVEDHKLREIEEQYRNPQRCKHEMLSRWLRKGHNCSWRRVVEVLMLMGEMVVADTIRLKYLVLTTEPIRNPLPYAGHVAISNPAAVAFAQKSRMKIQGSFALLVTHARHVLKHKVASKEFDVDDFHFFLTTLYSCGGRMDGKEFVGSILKATANLNDILVAIVTHRLWDYMNYDLLEFIIDKFAGDDEKLTQMLDGYKQELTGFMLATKIEHYLAVIDSEPPHSRQPPIPMPELFQLLSCKVKVKITDHSLKYVRDLWKSLGKQFELPMPMLLLHMIAKGCLELMWRIPCKFSAHIILKTKSRDYYRKQGFLNMSIGSIHIYVESEAAKDKVSTGMLVESRDSEVNYDTSGATEAHSFTEIGEDGSGEDTVPAVTHTVTFKCIGVMRERRYQEVLRRAKDLRALGIDVPVEIAPEPDNPKDSRAVAVTCYVHGTWHRIGYLVQEVLEEVHEAIEHKKILSVKFAWISYITEWKRSGPGFFAGINISKSGKWPQSVMLASSTK